jgi:NADPH:quinone reductase-like Zn-dependent oxidoreductase
VKAYEVREAIGLDGLVLNAERPDTQPRPHEIKIRVRAAALNYRDIGVIRGVYGYTKFPVIPLSDGAGEVVAVGEAVTGFKVGDRAISTFFQNWPSGRIPADASKYSLGGMADGMLAEYVCLPEGGAVHAPAHLSFEEAATLPVAALTAWHALIESGHLKAGDTVAMLGTGGVSIFALQFARMHGAQVFVTSSSDAKLERARALGAAAGINYRDRPEWDQDMIRLTGGTGVDHVVEVGGAGTLERSINAVRYGGTIYVIGAVAGRGQIDPRPINRKSIRLQGIHGGSREMFEAMNRALTTTALQPVIDRVFPFDETKAAYAHQISGAHFGKVVISLQ